MANNLLITALLPHPPIIIPDVGKDRIADAQATVDAMKEISSQIVASNPDTIVIVTPHSIYTKDTFTFYTQQELTSSFANFGAPQVEFSIENDFDFLKALDSQVKNRTDLAKIGGIKPGTPLDHGSGVPLYYLKQAGYKGKVVVLNYCACGSNEHIEFGKVLRQAMSECNKKFAFVASGDLSHKLTETAPAGFHPEGKNFDKIFVDSIKQGDYKNIINMDGFVRKSAGECAYNSMMMAIGALNEAPDQNKVFSYEGPFGVGYLVATL